MYTTVAGSLFRVAITTGSIYDQITGLGSAPSELAWDGANHMYVVNSGGTGGDNTISRINFFT